MNNSFNNLKKIDFFFKKKMFSSSNCRRRCKKTRENTLYSRITPKKNILKRKVKKDNMKFARNSIEPSQPPLPPSQSQSPSKIYINEQSPFKRQRLTNNKSNIGTILGEFGYKVHQIIGEGMSSNVYIATDRNSQKIAIKNFKPNYIKRNEDCINTEIELLKTVSKNDYIIKFINEINKPNYKAIIFEYYDINLFHYLDELIINKENIKNINLIIYSIIYGVESLHHFNIIHKDLKPENIFIKKNGNIISKVVVGDLGNADIYTSKKIIGNTSEIVTAWYRAPEIGLMIPYDNKIDIWSLGCIIYEILKLTPFNNFCCENNNQFTKSENERKRQISLIRKTATNIGTPEKKFIDKYNKYNISKYFIKLQNIESKEYNDYLKLNDEVKPFCEIYNYILNLIFKWDPDTRPSATQIIKELFTDV